MLQKVKDYLYLDGNFEDALIQTFINAAQNYIECSLKDTTNVEKVRQDQRYELLTLMLTAHFYNNRGVSIEQATHTIPHGVYPMLQQLDLVKGEETPVDPTPPVDPDEPTYVKINGANYEYVSRTATSITLAPTETVPTITAPFINIDGIDYAYNSTQGSTISFFELGELSILNENKTPYKAFKGFSRVPNLYLKTFEDLTGKLVELLGLTYELTQTSVYTYGLQEYVPAPVEPTYDDEVDIYSTTTGTRIGTFDADTSNMPTLIIKDRVLSSDEYYMSAWGTFPGIMIKDTSTTVKSYSPPVYDFNEDYSIIDGTTMFKRGLNQTAHSFIFEDMEYDLTNPRNYIDHTIFDYTAVPYEEPVEPEPVGTIINYDVYMDYQKASTSANRGYQKSGTGSALFNEDNLTLVQPTYMVGLEQFITNYYEPSSPRLVHDTDNNLWYEAETTPHGLVQLTPATAPTFGARTNYKPRIELLTKDLSSITVSTANRTNYQFAANTGMMTLGWTPNKEPGVLRSPDHTNTSENLCFLTPAVSWTNLTHHENDTSSYVRLLDVNNKVVGYIPMTVDTATVHSEFWPSYDAVYVDIPEQGIRTIVSYDATTGLLSWE